MKTTVFFGELKRRNVLRAGAIYIAAVWALAQGIAQLSAPFGLPDWVTRWFVIACAVGFPFWIAFAWFYELTPSGLKRESGIKPEDSIARHTGKKFDRWILAIMAVAIVLLVTNQFVLRRDATSSANSVDVKAIAATLAKLPDKSVAVLPLANESGDPEQRYFSDGLSEELISDLTQIAGLKVIGRYSSFKFRDSNDSPAQIGATLGVTNLVEGTLFQRGDRIRVTVSMIRAADGASVWSHTYDEHLKDVFAIQTRIGRAVAEALKIKLLGQTPGVDDRPPSGNVDAYRLMLQGREAARRATEAGFRDGILLFQQALKLDPGYAYAWGSLSNAWVNLGVFKYVTGDALHQAYAQARVAADKEQTLAPDVATTYIDRGYLLSQVDNDPEGALAQFKKAYALAPNDGTVISFLAGGFQAAGQLQQSAEMYRKAIATDPLRTDFYNNLADVLLQLGQLDAAERTIRKALALQPDYPGLYLDLGDIDMARGNLDVAEQETRKALAMQPNYPGMYGNLALIDILRGNADAALRAAKKEIDPGTRTWTLVAIAQIGRNHKDADAALQAYIARNGHVQPYNVADLYALRKQPDQTFEWLGRALKQRDPTLTGLLSDPLILAYQHDPRFAAFCKQAGLPLPREAQPSAGVPAAASSA